MTRVRSRPKLHELHERSARIPLISLLKNGRLVIIEQRIDPNGKDDMVTPNKAAEVEVMDLTKVAQTLPQPPMAAIARENMLATISNMLQGTTEIVVVEGQEGIGKTTLLAQFARAMPNQVISVFVKSSSRWAYAPEVFINEICNQTGWILSERDFKFEKDAGDHQALRNSIFQLQKHANWKRKTFFFVIDGLEDIPLDDAGIREQIIDLLPIGLPNFRFILSGPLDCLARNPQKAKVTKSWELPGFNFDETIRYFCDLVSDRQSLETIYRASKGIPGHLAAVRRLLQSGTAIDQLINDLPEKLPELFRIEWRAVPDNAVSLKMALAILAFDRRHHTCGSLARLAKIDANQLEDMLRPCTFIVQTSDTDEINFVSESWKRFAASQLVGWQGQARDTVINDLIDAPDSDESLIHLPNYLHDANRYEELLQYLSPDHIGRMIDCSQSWGLVQQKTELGVDTARKLNRDADLLRFCLQRSAVKSMESAEPWRSEIEAYVALNDFLAAYAVAQRAVTREDRLHMLSLVARARKKQSLAIEVELTDQIKQLYAQLDLKSLGRRGVEIAADLIYTHPELAIEMIQACMGANQAGEGIDWVFATLSLRALVERERDGDTGETCAKLRSRIKDPNVQMFMDRTSLLLGGYSATDVISEVEKWEKPADRIFLMRMWATTNARREDAGTVVEHALNTVIKTTEFAPNAKVFSDLSAPLPYASDKQKTKELVARFDSQKAAIEPTGPTQEFVRLQLRLARAESTYDEESAFNRLQEVFFYINDIKDLATKATSLALLATALDRIDPNGEYEKRSGIHTTAKSDLTCVLREILAKTADHYEAVSGTIRVLATSGRELALSIAKTLNTEPRRDEALVDIVEAIGRQNPKAIDFSFVTKVIGDIIYDFNRGRAIAEFLRGLLTHRDDLGSVVQQILPFVQQASAIADAEERCRTLCAGYDILQAYKQQLPGTFLEYLTEQIQKTWKAIDAGWSRIDAGFRMVALLAESDPELARNQLKATLEARKQTVLDSEDAAHTYVGCIRLALKTFGGLLKRAAFKPDDLESLNELIERIPSSGTRAVAWGELALRLFRAQRIQEGQQIVTQHVRPIVEAFLATAPIQEVDSIVLVAPALYCTHRGSTFDILRRLSQPHRDMAFREVCAFIHTKALSFEPYDSITPKHCYLKIDEIWDICEVLWQIETDSTIYYYIQQIVESADDKRNRGRYSRQQLADIVMKLKEISAKFPAPRFIQHDGYRIIADGQIARLERASPQTWDALVLRAKALGNVSDRAFVLCTLAAAMPGKLCAKSEQLFQDAKSLSAQIPTLEDRIDHYEMIARLSAESNNQLSRACIQMAFQEAELGDASKLKDAKKRLIDLAYRIEPDFAANLASKTDDDPARTPNRQDIRNRLEALKLKERLLQAPSELPNERTDEDLYSEAALMLVAGLNAGRVSPVHIERTRDYIQNASRLPMNEAFPVITWVVENAVKRYSDTDQVSTILKPLYEATIIASQLAFRLATRLQFIAETGVEKVAMSSSSLIHGGEREKALEHFRTWVADKAKEFIKICDPFFGPEDLAIVDLIRSVNPTIPIWILTSKKHQVEENVPPPWDEAYRRHWRLSVSDSDPGDVRIVIIGTQSTGEPPIHDRWWLSQAHGLRLGTSVNSIGISKISDLSRITESDVPSYLATVDRYLHGTVREHKNEKLFYSYFNL